MYDMQIMYYLENNRIADSISAGFNGYRQINVVDRDGHYFNLVAWPSWIWFIMQGLISKYENG